MSRSAFDRLLPAAWLCFRCASELSVPYHIECGDIPAASFFLSAISAAPCSNSSKLLACLSSSFVTLSIVLVMSATRFSEWAIWVSTVTISGFCHQLVSSRGQTSAHLILQGLFTLLHIRFPLLDVQGSSGMFFLCLPELLIALILSSAPLISCNSRLKHVNRSIDHLQLPPF